MRITIAIPTYNSEATIERAVQSCLEQQPRTQCEILVVNNSSRDGTSELLSKYADRVTIKHNRKTVPMFENHNICLREAAGDYVVFCHSDDLLCDGAVEMLLRKVEERNFPSKYMLWGTSYFRDATRSVQACGFNLDQMFSGFYSQQVFMSGGITPSGSCFSREALLDLGGFLPTTKSCGMFDMMTEINMALKGFCFEMMPLMIIDRRYASTATDSVTHEQYLDALDDAFSSLYSGLDEREKETLKKGVLGRRVPPLEMYFALASLTRLRKRLLKSFLGATMRQPSIARQRMYFSALKRQLAGQ